MMNYKPDDVEWPGVEICGMCGKIGYKGQYQLALLKLVMRNGDEHDVMVYLCPECLKRGKPLPIM